MNLPAPELLNLPDDADALKAKIGDLYAQLLLADELAQLQAGSLSESLLLISEARRVLIGFDANADELHNQMCAVRRLACLANRRTRPYRHRYRRPRPWG